MNLEKGSGLNLSKTAITKHKIIVGVKWDGDLDLDLSAISRNYGEKKSKEQNILFYNQQSIAGMKHSGDAREGDASIKSYNESIEIDLDLCRKMYSDIEIILTIFDEKKTDPKFGMTNVTIDIICDNNIIASSNISDMFPEARGMHLATINNKNPQSDETEYHVVLEASANNLAGFLTEAGIEC